MKTPMTKDEYFKIDPEHLKVINDELKRLTTLLADPNLSKETADFVRTQIAKIHEALLPNKGC